MKHRKHAFLPLSWPRRIIRRLTKSIKKVCKLFKSYLLKEKENLLRLSLPSRRGFQKILESQASKQTSSTKIQHQAKHDPKNCRIVAKNRWKGSKMFTKKHPKVNIWSVKQDQKGTPKCLEKPNWKETGRAACDLQACCGAWAAR